MPQGLQDLSGFFSAPLAGYNVPLPFFSGDDAPLWHTAIGYEIAGIIGMLALGGVILWRLLSGPLERSCPRVGRHGRRSSRQPDVAAAT